MCIEYCPYIQVDDESSVTDARQHRSLIHPERRVRRRYR